MVEEKKRGKLIVIGSGISSISHLTLEAIGFIRNADVVFYNVADPATELFIRNLNKNSIDLYEWYDDGKPREETYVQMAELMLEQVRHGKNTVGVFYGNAAIFATPTHRAFSIAKKEGYDVKVIPGISSIDCLFGDLNVDPADGCQIFEATDLLVRNRRINIDQSAIILQVGAVGNFGFNFEKINNSNFGVLVDYLANIYGGDHEIIHYIASIYPFQEPFIERVKLSELKDYREKITGISTFYIPPKINKPLDNQYIKKLGLVVLDREGFKEDDLYGVRERIYVSRIKTHITPVNYRPVTVKSNLYNAILKLSLSPWIRDEFKKSPMEVITKYFMDLNDDEIFALYSMKPGVVRFIMQGGTKKEILDRYGKFEAVEPNKMMHVVFMQVRVDVDISVTNDNNSSNNWYITEGRKEFKE